MTTATLRRTAIATLSFLAGSMIAVVPCVAAPIDTDSSGVANPQPFGNVQPSLAIHMTFPLQGTFGNGLPIRMFAYSDTRMALLQAQGWITPAGQILAIQSNQSLFAQLGAHYGGNGQTTFALPDLRGRTPIGQGQGFGTSNYTRGQVVGTATSTLTLNTLPAHSHPHAKAVTGLTGVAGGGGAVPSMQPSIAMNWSITVNGDFPPFNGNGAPSKPNDPCKGHLLLHSATPSGAYAGVFEPADGGVIPVALNTGLFAILGTTYGGNGQTTFGKPDLRGSAACGVGDGPATEERLFGEVFGNEVAPLGVANLPPHIHTVSASPELGPTGNAGSAQPFSNAQRTLGIGYIICLAGDFPGAGGPNDNNAYLGEIIAFAGTFLPSGYARCEGQILPISQNASLFSLLGTTFGGNGATTFALPDLRGRVPVGASLGAGGTPAGTALGTEHITLTSSNIPAHTHTLQPYCPADIGMQGGIVGHDGFRDNNDFVVFVDRFFANDPISDFGAQGGIPGPDGLYDNNDFVAFIDAFFATCPW
ncbi:MAG TPA: tail fiber protein [Phycisphaerales bacterium]|nr:tail fiber protein [Phycisphaerales bacterium]